MEQVIWQVDSFTAEPFRGNPAAVVILDGRRVDDDWMAAVAREMNLSETAFLRPGRDAFSLRWFTPVAEVDLCGHATLATAHILYSEGVISQDSTAEFDTRSGRLRARRLGDGWIELDFPATPAEPTTASDLLLQALGVTSVRFAGENRFDTLLELASEDQVRSLRPDFGALRAITRRGAIVTAPAGTPGVDFVSRYFAPAVGIDEDPVTGSAHCTLGPFWAARLGKSELLARQVSDRGGALRVRVADGRVYLAGEAVTVLRAELLAG